jgi:hypothetical protein
MKQAGLIFLLLAAGIFVSTLIPMVGIPIVTIIVMWVGRHLIDGALAPVPISENGLDNDGPAEYNETTGSGLQTESQLPNASDS